MSDVTSQDLIVEYQQLLTESRAELVRAYGGNPSQHYQDMLEASTEAVAYARAQNRKLRAELDRRNLDHKQPEKPKFEEKKSTPLLEDDDDSTENIARVEAWVQSHEDSGPLYAAKNR